MSHCFVMYTPKPLNRHCQSCGQLVSLDPRIWHYRCSICYAEKMILPDGRTYVNGIELYTRAQLSESAEEQIRCKR